MDLNMKATELRLGLPGSDENENKTIAAANAKNNKRGLADMKNESDNSCLSDARGGCPETETETAPAAKQQVVGWPPVRSYRKNSFQQPKKDEGESRYVKVSMDGAPYLRKIDLKVYNGYLELLRGLENIFKITIGTYSEREGYDGSEHAPTYEDKDGDWMLVGDVPWNMFISSCKKLRIIKGSQARGLGTGV